MGCPFLDSRRLERRESASALHLYYGTGPARSGGHATGWVVDLDARLALSAARVSLDMRLPMADSVVLATAKLHEATLWTQDADFEGLPGVRYRARKR